MSRFYAQIEGNRGPATRQGTEKSGICGHVRGWDVGVQVNGDVGANGEDVFYVTATGGSNGRRAPQYLGRVQIVNGTLTFTPKED